MFLGNAMLEIALVSLAMVIVSQFLQRKFIDRKAVKASQDKIKEKQKRLKELLAKGDSKSKAEAEKLQNEMLQMLNDNMQGTMKHMLVSFPIFIAVFWFLGITYAGIAVQLPIAVPVMHRNFSIEITSSISWLWWYIYSSLIFGIIFSGGLKAAGK